MRYFLDTEFIDDGQTIDLISIGIVCEDGRELYLQSCEFDPQKASEWVKENVLIHLDLCQHANIAMDQRQPYVNDIHYHNPQGQCTFEQPARGISGLRGLTLPNAVLIGAYEDCPWRTREQIKHEVRQFFNPSDGFELWGWCAGYDFVAFCQLFGTMMDLPQGWPHYIKDLQYVLDERGIKDDELPGQEEGIHNALEDAKHIEKLWGYIVRNDAWQ